MITITPYARQGMIQSLLSGDVEHQQLEVITDEQFVGLRKAYFMVAVVNVAAGEMSAQQFRDAQELIAHACRELSTEERTVVCCTKNAQNLFVIINSDDGEGMEALFYRMYQSCVEALDDPRFAVTLGVSRLESDIQALRDACTDAEQALGQMMTGGRSSVYFHEDVQDKAQRRYYFPRDAHKRIVRGLKEGNLPDLEAMLGEIHRCNAQEAELPVSELRLMVEELHVTIRNALRDVFDLSTTHIQIERIREAATLEEIFAYYRTVLATAISQRGELPDAGEERAGGEALRLHRGKLLRPGALAQCRRGALRRLHEDGRTDLQGGLRQDVPAMRPRPADSARGAPAADDGEHAGGDCASMRLYQPADVPAQLQGRDGHESQRLQEIRTGRKTQKLQKQMDIGPKMMHESAR